VLAILRIIHFTVFLNLNKTLKRLRTKVNNVRVGRLKAKKQYE